MQENTREKGNGTEISEEASDAPAVNEVAAELKTRK